MKYLVFNDGKFYEFNNWNEVEYFTLDKPKARYKKINSKKAEQEFRQMCNGSPIYIPKIYVVIYNNKVIRFEKWTEAKTFISRHREAKYKSFTSEEEAQIFINSNVHGLEAINALACVVEDGDVYLVEENKKEKIATVSGSFIEKEVKGVILGIKKAIERKEEYIIIKYRNNGIEMWANKTWKANKVFSQEYQKEIEELRKKINIDFIQQGE